MKRKIFFFSQTRENINIYFTSVFSSGSETPKGLFCQLHLSIHYLKPLIHFRVTGGQRHCQLALGDSGVQPWINHQLVTGLTRRDKQPFILTLAPTGNLESLINFLDLGASHLNLLLWGNSANHWPPCCRLLDL